VLHSGYSRVKVLSCTPIDRIVINCYVKCIPPPNQLTLFIYFPHFVPQTNTFRLFIYFAHCSCLISTLRLTTSVVRCHQTVRRDATWPLGHRSGLVFGCGTCELSVIVCERLCEFQPFLGTAVLGKVGPLNNGVYG
jgi:hypothetical protein